jgi:hypothetical protein
VDADTSGGNGVASQVAAERVLALAPTAPHRDNCDGSAAFPA